GQVQIAYATPDDKGAMVGAMFGQDGENITVSQIRTLMQTNKDVGNLIASMKKEEAAISSVGSPPPKSTPASASALPSTPLSPGDRLIRDLQSASTVVVGNPSSPEILMVMDPHCHHCQETWRALRASVLAGEVHLRMVPIGVKGTDNERAAAIFLMSADPTSTWDKYVTGNRSLLSGKPTAAALAAVRANLKLATSWHISGTPYIVYRAKNGEIKIINGTPDNAAALVADVGG
ncbi:MAG: hypothetical protein KGI97_07650, partial [Alphaproteobacteria bacterium]|nr:hypothetical protein [Alphaproteobacteria bacterium]